MNMTNISETILIVDDTLENLRLLSQILTEKGYKVRAAKSGNEALESIKTLSPDLILLDVKMPDLNGYEICKKLKASDGTCSIPVLFLSSLTEENDRLCGFAVGGVDYITKPFSYKEVIMRVQTHLEISRFRKLQSEKLKLMNDQLLIELTEHKSQEEKIRKLNRLYSVLYDIDEVIVQIHDKTKLFNEVCKIAFKDGDFLMSWIGLVNNENKVDVIASSGFSENYLSNIDIDLKDEKRSGGPTGRAIKLGEYQLSNDIMNDESMNPWKKEAIRLGYKASASFPLKISGKVRGALTLYANEVGFFTTDEIKLLEKLSSNLSFAIEFIESEEERKRTEKALLESEAHMKSISNNFTNGMIYQVVIKPDGTRKFTYLSDSVKQLYGISSEEGMLDANLIYSKVCEDDIELLIKTENESVKNLSTFKSEVRIKEPSGKMRWSYLVSTPTILNDGSICFDGIEFIITDRKQAENELKLTNNLMNLIVENIPNMIFLKDAKNLRFLQFNKAGEELLGYSRNDLIGKNDYDFFPKEQADFFTLKDKEILNNKDILDIPEEPIQTSHKGIRILHTKKVPILNDKGDAEYLLGISEDITERKLTENIINAHLSLIEFSFNHSTTELLQKTLDEVCHITNSTIGFYHFVEPDQKTLSLQAWSTRTLQEYCKAKGNGLHYSLEQAGVWGDCIRERKPIIHNDYASLENKKGLPEGHASLIRELTVPIMRDGIIVAIIGIGNKSLDYDKKDADIVAYFADVAWEVFQKKRAEEELYKMNEELEQRVIKRTKELENANKELESFSYSVSHDLRAPLRAIDGFSNILLRKYFEKLGEEEQRLLNRVCDNAKKMSHLIDDLLAFSRTNRKELDKSEVDMNLIVKHVYDEVTSEEEKDKIDFSVDDLPKVKGDEAMLKQIWINLISNAIKFTSKIEKPQIKISFKTEKGNNIYFVKDNGIGFDMAYANKLFSVFQRLHTEEEYKGTGVGLAIVKSIINKHGGKIWVESEIDKGTTFYFWI